MNDLYASIASRKVKRMVTNSVRASIDKYEANQKRGVEKSILEEVTRKCVKKV